MSVKNSAPLSERLLCLLKSETSLHDCLTLKCRDSVERKAHRTVLIASSSHFAKLLLENPGLGVVDVPFTSDVIDIVIEFMYSSDAVQFEKKQAIQLYSAAKGFALETLSQQMETFFQFSMDSALRDEGFLKDDTAEDMQSMKKIFSSTLCEKLLLVSRILRWGKTKKASPDLIIELLDSVVASLPPSSSPARGESDGTRPSPVTTSAVTTSPVTVAAAPKPSSPTTTFSFGAAASAAATPVTVPVTPEPSRPTTIFSFGPAASTAATPVTVPAAPKPSPPTTIFSFGPAASAATTPAATTPAAATPAFSFQAQASSTPKTAPTQPPRAKLVQAARLPSGRHPSHTGSQISSGHQPSASIGSRK